MSEVIGEATIPKAAWDELLRLHLVSQEWYMQYFGLNRGALAVKETRYNYYLRGVTDALSVSEVDVAAAVNRANKEVRERFDQRTWW